MGVVANAVASRVFFGVFKIHKPIFPSVTRATTYTAGNREGQRHRLQTQSMAGLGTEWGGQPSSLGAGSLGVSGGPLPPV